MVSDCIIKFSKCSKHYPTQNTRIISYNLSYSCTSSSNGFRHQNYTGKYWSQFFCRLDRSAIGQHRSLYKMCIRLRHPYRFSNSGMPALVFRPENLNHGDILCRPSWPFVSMTQVYTIRLRDTGLYHTSLAHQSLASVVAFPFGDLNLGLLFQGKQSAPFLLAFRLGNIRLD